LERTTTTPIARAFAPSGSGSHEPDKRLGRNMTAGKCPGKPDGRERRAAQLGARWQPAYDEGAVALSLRICAASPKQLAADSVARSHEVGQLMSMDTAIVACRGVDAEVLRAVARRMRRSMPLPQLKKGAGKRTGPRAWI